MYVPKVGDRFRLRDLSIYASLGFHSTWSHFKVVEVGDTGVEAVVMDGDQEKTARCSIAFDWIEPPLGWEEVYTMIVRDAEHYETVRSWYPRGVAVWCNHYIGDPGAIHAFTPADKPSPHWKYLDTPLEILSESECWTRLKVICYDDHALHGAHRIAGSQKVAKRLRIDGWTVNYDKREKRWAVYKTITLQDPKEHGHAVPQVS